MCCGLIFVYFFTACVPNKKAWAKAADAIHAIRWGGLGLKGAPVAASDEDGGFVADAVARRGRGVVGLAG